MAPSLYRHKEFVQIPGVAHPAPSAPELPGVFEPERLTPLADGFVRDADAPLGEQIFYIAEAQAEAVIQPDGVADDLGGKAVSAVAVQLVIGLVCQPCITLTVSIIPLPAEVAR